MQCPKQKPISLIDAVLEGELPIKLCPDCQGNWISAHDYHLWQDHYAHLNPEAVPKRVTVDYSPSSFDTKGALCPECNAYLARAKVNAKNPFYVERCVKCGGIWCDRGEWDVLRLMDMHIAIDQFFSSEWQARMKEREYLERERRATIEKLGEELAQRVFELAELLANHPNGDFGVAYLMRRFDSHE